MSPEARRGQRGQALVETALMITVLTVLLMGLIEFGFILWAHVQVSNATREGARAGSLWRLNEEVTGLSCYQTVRRAVGGNGFGGGELRSTWNPDVTTSLNCTTTVDPLVMPAPGENLTVSVSYRYPLPIVSALPWLRDILGQEYVIDRTIVIRFQ